MPTFRRPVPIARVSPRTAASLNGPRCQRSRGRSCTSAWPIVLGNSARSTGAALCCRLPECLLSRHQSGSRFLLRENRQADEQELHSAGGAQRKLLPAREGRVLSQRLAIDCAVALQHEADLNAAARRHYPLRVRVELQHRELQVTLGKIAQVLPGEARRDRFPVEARRLDEDRLAVARLRIDELALVDVLPDRLIAVLVALLARRELADALEDALLEGAELLHLIHGAMQPRRAHEAVAARAAELQRDAEPLAVAALRPIGRTLREIGKLTRLDPFAVAVVLALAFQAHADLIEIVLVAGHVDLALLPHEVEPEIVERLVVADQQRLELAFRAANAADLRAVFGMGNLHGSRLLVRL